MKYANLLVISLPAAVVCYWLEAPAVLTFVASAVALVYLAAAMGWATEVLAGRTGPTVGGLMNASLGNGAELIIALVGVRAGLAVVVKASLTGSILGNALLVTGAAFFLGGLRYKEQQFNAAAAQSAAKLMVIAASALLMPSLFHFATGSVVAERQLSVAIAAILVGTYVANIIFSLITHRHIFPHHSVVGARVGAVRSGLVLVLTTVGMVVAAEILVRVIEPTAHVLGWNDVFIGVVLVAIAGNAAENFGAVLMGWRDRMDLALTITLGSSLQIALLVAPVVTLVSYLWPTSMDLVFTPLEVAAVALSMLIISLATADGKSDWFEGALLLALYAIIAVTFFYLG